MEKYKLEYRGNVKEFEDYILDNLRREQEQGQSLRWSKFVEVYARQLAIIQECPYPETESELGNDETVCGKINLHTIAAQKYITPQAA